MRSAIASHFQKQLTEEDVTAIVGALQSPGRLTIADGKVVYANGG